MTSIYKTCGVFSTSLSLFSIGCIFIIGAGIKAPEQTMQHYKRQWRELSDEHKDKISQSSKNKPKSAEHRQHISQAMIDYWRGVPHKPEDGDGLTMDEYLNGR